MIVPKAMLKDWEDNLDPGDKEALEEYLDCSGPTVTKLFKGEGHEKLIAKTNVFFAEKKERLAKSFIK